MDNMVGPNPGAAQGEISEYFDDLEPAASAPKPLYRAPSYGSVYPEEETLPDLTPRIIGILIVTGLSILFPSFVSLTSVRRKREVGKRCTWGTISLGQ